MSYAFLLPHLLFGCLHYELAVGERFGNFEIRQPMTFTLNSHSWLHDSMFHAHHHCAINVISMPEWEIPLENKTYNVQGP